jgi:RNA polymerase sigma factor (TIGR02999 family)
LLRVSSNEVTELLIRWSEGNTAARDELIPLVYEELRRLARRFLAGQRSNHSLQSTALVHEAYLRLVDCSSVHWQTRAQFFGLAAQLMRQILVDHARTRNAAKRKGNHLTLTLDQAAALPKKPQIDLIALDDALNELAALDARQSKIVELRFFGGLSIEDTSYVLGISPKTVKREWATARTWLYQEIS